MTSEPDLTAPSPRTQVPRPGPAHRRPPPRRTPGGPPRGRLGPRAAARARPAGSRRVDGVCRVRRLHVAVRPQPRPGRTRRDAGRGRRVPHAGGDSRRPGVPRTRVALARGARRRAARRRWFAHVRRLRLAPAGSALPRLRLRCLRHGARHAGDGPGRGRHRGRQRPLLDARRTGRRPAGAGVVVSTGAARATIPGRARLTRRRDPPRPLRRGPLGRGRASPPPWTGSTRTGPWSPRWSSCRAPTCCPG